MVNRAAGGSSKAASGQNGNAIDGARPASPRKMEGAQGKNGAAVKRAESAENPPPLSICRNKYVYLLFVLIL